MDNNEIRALLEGAYAQTPTLPGFFVNYEEFRSRFNKLIEERSDMPLDVEKILNDYYPDAKFEECYQPQGTDEVFKAFRIAPQKLKCISILKKRIEVELKSIQTNNDGSLIFNPLDRKDIIKIREKKTPIIIFGPTSNENRNNISSNKYNFIINNADEEKDINKFYSTIELGFSE